MKPLAVFAIAATFAAAAIAKSFTISTIACNAAAPRVECQHKKSAGDCRGHGGNIHFIANRAVYELDQGGGTVTHIAGINTSGHSGDGGDAISAQLGGPMALAVDPAGNLYIEEAGGHIRKVDVDGIITTIVGNRVCHGLSITEIGAETLTADPASSALYAVTNSDLLLKSTDGSNSWTVLSGVTGLTSLLIDPRKSDTLYAGTHHGVISAHVESARFNKSQRGDFR